MPKLTLLEKVDRAWVGAMVVLALIFVNITHQIGDRTSDNEHQQLNQTTQVCDETQVELRAQGTRIANLQAEAKAKVEETLRQITEDYVPGGSSWRQSRYELVEGRVAEWSAEKFERQYGYFKGPEAEQEYDALHAGFVESC